MNVTLTNLITNGGFEQGTAWSGVTYDTAQHYQGSRSSKMAGNSGTIMNSQPMPVPIAGHIYYGRHYIKTAGNNTPADCRFEWFAGDGAGLNFVFGWNNGNHPDWYMESTRMQISQVNGASYILRSFVVNGTADMWADGLMIIDLTAAFGAGGEPSKEWCDANIPFFDGSYTIDYKKIVLAIVAAAFAPNPVAAGAATKLSVSVLEVVQEPSVQVVTAGEVTSGEV